MVVASKQQLMKKIEAAKTRDKRKFDIERELHIEQKKIREYERELKVLKDELNQRDFKTIQKSSELHAELRIKYFPEEHRLYKKTDPISISTDMPSSLTESDMNTKSVRAQLSKLQSDNLYIAQKCEMKPYDYYQSVELWLMQFYIQNKMRITADIELFSEFMKESIEERNGYISARTVKTFVGLVLELNHTSNIIKFNNEDDLSESLDNISWGVESDNEDEGLPKPKVEIVPKDNESKISTNASAGNGDTESVTPKKTDTEFEVKSNHDLEGFLYVPDFDSIPNNCGDVNPEEIAVPFKKVNISELPPSEADYIRSIMMQKRVSGYAEGVQSELLFKFNLYSVQHLMSIHRDKNEQRFLDACLD